MRESKVERFRKSPEAVKRLREILSDETMQDWLEAMDEENPASGSIPKEVTPQQAHIMLGENQGWMQYRDRFRLGAIRLEDASDPRTPANQTYGATQKQE